MNEQKYLLPPTPYVTRKPHPKLGPGWYPIGSICTVHRTHENPTILVLTFEDGVTVETQGWAPGVEKNPFHLMNLIEEEDQNFFDAIDTAMSSQKEGS